MIALIMPIRVALKRQWKKKKKNKKHPILRFAKGQRLPPNIRDLGIDACHIP